MMELLIVTFFVILSTSLQKESAEDLSPARIFLAHSRVKEGQEVKFKCKVADVRTGWVYVLLCKNGVTVKTVKLEESKVDSEFVIDRVAVKDSGSYTCFYSDANHSVCGINFKGRNSVSLEVFDLLLQDAMIQSARTTVAKGENIELTCSISEYLDSPALHMYLLKDGEKRFSYVLNNENHTQFSIKNVRREDSGIYSCVYTAKTYHTYEAGGEKSILIQVYDPQWQVNFIRLLVSGGVVIFACIVVIFDIKTR